MRNLDGRRREDGVRLDIATRQDIATLWRRLFRVRQRGNGSRLLRAIWRAGARLLWRLLFLWNGIPARMRTGVARIRRVLVDAFTGCFRRRCRHERAATETGAKRGLN